MVFGGMLTLALQEGTEIQFDPGYIDGPQAIHDRVLILLLLFLLLVGLVITVQLWRCLGGTRGSMVRSQLEHLSELLVKRELGQVADVARRISPEGPEKEIREWATTGTSGDKAFLKRVLISADAWFRRELAVLRVKAERLFTLAIIAGFATMLNLILDLVLGLGALRIEEAFGRKMAAFFLGSLLANVFLGLFVITVTFLAYRYFVMRLRLREVYWTFFYTRSKDTLEKPDGTGTGA